MVQAGNGVVIYRPFHEAGGTWFWWSMEGGASTSACGSTPLIA